MLIARIRRTLVDRALVSSGDRIVSACSLGPDSVAMTHALSALTAELGFSLVVASVDHGLRAEAGEEVARVGELCERLRLPFHPLRVRFGPGPSLQAEARNARYGALLELAARIQAHRVAVGHTQDDQAETVLCRLLRGASLTGLSGIDPHRPDGVIRPLIDCRRAEVEAHIRHFDLPFVDDPSNRDRRFLRARVRHQHLPALLDEDPQLVAHLASLADDARGTRTFLVDEAQHLLDRAGASTGTLDLDVAMSAPPPVRREALRRFLHLATGNEPNRPQREAAERLMVQRRGTVRLSEGFLLGERQGKLHLERG
ncbi:MAG: tRNA lysidine(34) synthetase TilS [Myxococcota bacterium]